MMVRGPAFVVVVSEGRSLMGIQESDLGTIADLIAQKLGAPAEVPSIVFSEFAERYLDEHARPYKKTWRQDERRIRRYILPRLGQMSVRDIGPREVTSLHTSLGRTPYAANRCLEIVIKMLRLAQEWGYYSRGKAIPSVRAYPELPRDRFVNLEEMERLSAAINSLRSRQMRTLLWLYLLTGVRKNELLALEWKDVCLEPGELRLGVTKNGQPHYLPLSEPAVVLLRDLPRCGIFVFPGTEPGTHRTVFDKPWNRVRAQANLNDVRLHDLRRTVGSWLAQSGIPLGLIGRVLNHRSSKSTEIYARFACDDVKRALQAHGDAIGRFITGA